MEEKQILNELHASFLNESRTRLSVGHSRIAGIRGLFARDGKTFGVDHPILDACEFAVHDAAHHAQRIGRPPRSPAEVDAKGFHISAK